MTATVTTITPSTTTSTNGRPAGALPITEGPPTTFDPAYLGARSCEVVAQLDAGRIGFHVETVTHAGDVTRRDYLTVAPTDAGGQVVMFRLLDNWAERVLSVVELAISDDLAGSVELTAFPLTNGGVWAVSRLVYTDAEGQVRG